MPAERCPKCQSPLRATKGDVRQWECGTIQAGEIQQHAKCMERQIPILTAERDAALLDAELLDFQKAFSCDVLEVDAGQGWTIRTLVAELNYWANTHGPWNSPRECLAACRDWQVNDSETGWANRPTNKGG